MHISSIYIFKDLPSAFGGAWNTWIGSKPPQAQRTELEYEQTVQGEGVWQWHSSDGRREQRDTAAAHTAEHRRLPSCSRSHYTQAFVAIMEEI